MKSIILFILFIVSIFIVNVSFYFSSDSYRDFLKRVKNESVKKENIDLNKDLSKNSSSYFSGKLEEKIVKEKEAINKIEENKNTDVKQEVKLGKGYQSILDMFSEYKLTMLDLKANLFDLTNEYPDSYYEFYSPKITLYFFTSKTYEQVYDIFSVLQTELPFKINKANNFGNNSFYINFNNDINDSFIRIVVENNGIVLGIKVKREEYDNIKQKLQNLRNN